MNQNNVLCALMKCHLNLLFTIIHGLHDTSLIKTDELAKSVMVIMIKGLNDKWKQPLAFYFVNTSCVSNDLKNIIFNCINTLEKISFNVKF